MADVGAKERRILVSVDEGEESRHALSWCLQNIISSKSNDTLVLLYVKPPRAVYTAMDGTGGRHYVRNKHGPAASNVLVRPKQRDVASPNQEDKAPAVGCNREKREVRLPAKLKDYIMP